MKKIILLFLTSLSTLSLHSMENDFTQVSPYQTQGPINWMGIPQTVNLQATNDTVLLMRYTSYPQPEEISFTLDGKIPSTFISNYYNKLLKKHEKTVWKKIEGNFGISRRECTELANKARLIFNTQVSFNADFQSMAAGIPPLPLKVVAFAQSVATNLNNKAVSFRSTNDNINFAAGAAVGAQIYISPSLLQIPVKYTEKISKFAVGHEVGHVNNEDSLNASIVATLTANRSYPFSSLPYLASIFIKFMHFHETRADIQTAAHSKEYAEGGIEFFSWALNDVKCDLNDLIHPLPKTRLSIVEHIAACHGYVDAHNQRICQLLFNKRIRDKFMEVTSPVAASCISTIMFMFYVRANNPFPSKRTIRLPITTQHLTTRQRTRKF